MLICTGIGKATIQLERRLKLFDAFMNIGLKKLTNYNAIIYIPTLGPSNVNTESEKEIQFLRNFAAAEVGDSKMGIVGGLEFVKVKYLLNIITFGS
jgi:hypothetical protein